MGAWGVILHSLRGVNWNLPPSLKHFFLPKPEKVRSTSRNMAERPALLWNLLLLFQLELQDLGPSEPQDMVFPWDPSQVKMCLFVSLSSLRGLRANPGHGNVLKKFTEPSPSAPPSGLDRNPLQNGVNSVQNVHIQYSAIAVAGVFSLLSFLLEIFELFVASTKLQALYSLRWILKEWQDQA